MTTSTTPVVSSAATDRRMPRSAMVTTGTSGSGMLPTAALELARRGPRRRHHVAPGCDRATCCISARRYPIGAEWTPCRPPRERQRESFGSVQRRLVRRPRRRGSTTASWSADGSTPAPASAAATDDRVVVEQLGQVREYGLERRPASVRATPRFRRRAAPPTGAHGRGGTRPPWSPWRPPRGRSRPRNRRPPHTARPGTPRTRAAGPSRTRSRRAPARRGGRCATAARRGASRSRPPTGRCRRARRCGHRGPGPVRAGRG